MIYEKVCELCERGGITIHQLEKTLGLANGLIGRWKVSSPTVHNLKKVADYFKVDIQYFLA